MSTVRAGARVALVEIVEGTRDPGFSPSPRLLALGQRAADEGALVSYHPPSPSKGTEELSADRIIIAAPGPAHALAERLRATLLSTAGDALIELFDPFANEESDGVVPAYQLARGKVSAHAEVDALPQGSAVHPWVLGSRANLPEERWQERLDAAAASLSGTKEPTLHLNDERIPLSMERLRGVAAMVRRGLREDKTLCRLNLRAWPEDLMSDSKLLDHLTLLPLASLDVLAGSFLEGSLLRHGRVASSASEALRQVSACGLSHLAMVSVAVGLPGESADDCVEGMRLAIDQAVAARIRRIRFSLWLGGALAPTDSKDQDRLFWQSHPGWHPLEYRGLFDFVALMQSALPLLSIVGPGFVPGWEPGEADEGAA